MSQMNRMNFNLPIKKGKKKIKENRKKKIK
jgi:hypothetical protein